MQLRVHEVNQMASGGSYVVIFEAEVCLHEVHEVTVEVHSVVPPETEIELVQLAKQAIAQGAEHVLFPLSKGASIQVHRLVVNSVDFKPNRFTLFTALELRKLLNQ